MPPTTRTIGLETVCGRPLGAGPVCEGRIRVLAQTRNLQGPSQELVPISSVGRGEQLAELPQELSLAEPKLRGDRPLLLTTQELERDVLVDYAETMSIAQSDDELPEQLTDTSWAHAAARAQSLRWGPRRGRRTGVRGVGVHGSTLTMTAHWGDREGPARDRSVLARSRPSRSAATEQGALGTARHNPSPSLTAPLRSKQKRAPSTESARFCRA